MAESNYPISIDPDIALWVSSLDTGTRELFEERAGIIQFDGGLSRAEAECEARNAMLHWLSKKT
jgi:hypothetical protein